MRINRTTAAIGFVGVITAVALTGCGSSSSGSPSDSTPSSQETFKLGDSQVNTGGQLPAYWPSDVPTPQGLAYEGGGQISDSITGAFSGSTPVETVQSQLSTDFKANGWTASAAFGGGSTGGVSSWKKGEQTTQVVVGVQDGKTVSSITIVTKPQQ